jgi:hypothetical protein
MARGWESKAVADQIEEGNQSTLPRPKQRSGPAERKRQSRLESLRLSRSRLLDQLDKAKQPAYRSILLNGLRAIEQEIEAVSSENVDDEGA